MDERRRQSNGWEVRKEDRGRKGESKGYCGRRKRGKRLGGKTGKIDGKNIRNDLGRRV